MRLRPFAAAAPFAAAVLLSAPPASAQQDVVAITRRAGPAVVTLHAFNAAGREESLGSGFFLPDGRIATNRHVVEGAARITVVGPGDRMLGAATYAEAIGTSADLAILPRVVAPPATLTVASSLPEAGESVVVIGAPEGLSNTVSTGIVSAIRQVSGKTYVQISAPISHGSSGGPVMNMRGEVIGVSVSILSEGQNLNFAVPATELLALERTSPGHIAFGNARGGDESAGGIDYEQQLDRRTLPRVTSGQTVSARLTQSDFRRRDGSFAKVYVYNGHAGEHLTVTLRSTQFDAWLEVDDPNGPMYEHDDDSAGGLDSRVETTLPHDGEYLIVANSVGADATGAFSLSVASGGSGGGVGPSTGQSGSITDLGHRRLPSIAAGQTVQGRLTTGSFQISDGTFADGYEYVASGAEQITVTMRSPSMDSYLVIDEPDGPFRASDDDSGGGHDAQSTVTLPHAGRYVIVANTIGRETGNYTLSVQRGGGGGNGGSVQPSQGGTGGSGALSELASRRLPSITAGETVSGRITSASFVRSDDGTSANGYSYYAHAGETVTVTLRSSDFDTWLVIDDPNGPMYEYDDDSAGGTDSRLTVTFPHDGQYLIVANTVGRGVYGAYTLTVERSGDSHVIRPLP